MTKRTLAVPGGVSGGMTKTPSEGVWEMKASRQGRILPGAPVGGGRKRRVLNACIGMKRPEAVSMTKRTLAVPGEVSGGMTIRRRLGDESKTARNNPAGRARRAPC